jgi:putative ABC transport system ATP-binding protein
MRKGEAIYQFNDQSDEMYILLSGQLGVYNENQLLLASIDPVAPVGEMGLITGQPRSATVSTLSDSNLLVLRKVAFDRLLRSNVQLCIQVYRSVIGAVGQRLAESRVSQHRNELEQKLSEVEDQVVAMSNGEGR